MHTLKTAGRAEANGQGGQRHTRLRVPLYRQTTDFTCGACATLMVWRYFDKKAKLSRQNEFLIWTETAALPFKFSSPYRIAAFFIKRDLATQLINEQITAKESGAPLECCEIEPADRKLFLDFFNAYNATLKRRIASSIEDRTPSLSDIRNALIAGSPVILLVDSYYTLRARGARQPCHLPHWIVVTGYMDGRFHINDSIHEPGVKPGKLVLRGRALSQAMDTFRRFGWAPAMITVQPKKPGRSSRRSP